MNLAKRTYMNLMIFKIIAEYKGSIFVQQIHLQIESNMGLIARSCNVLWLKRIPDMNLHTEVQYETP